MLSCKQKHRLPEIPPTLISEKVPHDSDDPAIWVNRENPEESIVFGTDKDEINGGVYAFDLDGKIIRSLSVTGLGYPNNIDVTYGFRRSDSSLTDLLVFSERVKQQIRIFALPEMIPVDKGGIAVFTDESRAGFRRPMGVSFYSNPHNDKHYVFVSRKIGPDTGYIYQYELVSDGIDVVATLVRKFGKFSGLKEIEAIAVDHELGYVYYGDEGIGIRKYHADPAKGDQEISLFGGEYFTDDIEGICIVRKEGSEGFLIVSDQGDSSFNIFRRDDNTFVKKINLGTESTDGCDVTNKALGNKFPNGLFVSMNDQRNFFYHALDSLKLD